MALLHKNILKNFIIHTNFFIVSKFHYHIDSEVKVQETERQLMPQQMTRIEVNVQKTEGNLTPQKMTDIYYQAPELVFQYVYITKSLLSSRNTNAFLIYQSLEAYSK